jgi:hypothetical protein
MGKEYGSKEERRKRYKLDRGMEELGEESVVM